MIEGAGPFGRDPPNRRGIGGVLEQVARPIAGAVGLGEIGGGVWGLGLRRGAIDHARQTRTDDKAIGGQTLGIAKQVLPSQLAMARLGEGQHRHRPGNAGRAATENRLEKADRLGDPIGIGAHEHVRARPGWRGLAAIIGGHGAGLGIIKDHKGPAAEARALRLDQTQRGLNGNGGIHR